MTSLASGKIEVFKIQDNLSTKLCEVDNMITVGLGYSIANLLTANQDEKTDNYTVAYTSFGFGAASTSPTPQASSYLFQLIDPVNVRFLNSNITAEVSELFYLKGTTFVTSADIEKSSLQYPFISLPASRVTWISTNAVQHTILLDNSFDQEYDIKEIGLFIKNPISTYLTDTPLLAAYKSFTNPINKPVGVKLKINWTIRFNI